MCIIVAKEKNVDLPSKEILKECFTNNPDGAGFMYTRKNKVGVRYVVVDKGYMTFESFISRYDELCRAFNNFKNKALVMHFRIGTSGSNNKNNTHPYPIASSHHILQKTNIWCDLGVVHNGIIHDYTPLPGNNINNTNDTQEFIMKYLYPLHTNYKDFYKNEYIMNGISDITNSKLAFLDTHDNIYYSGDFVEDEGVNYSNETYKSWRSRYNYGSYGKYNDYDYDDYDNYSYGHEYGYAHGSAHDNKLVSKGTPVDLKSLDIKNIVSIPKNWFLTIGYQTYDAFNREFYFNIETTEAYEVINDKMYKIGDNAIVLDEQYEWVY